MNEITGTLQSGDLRLFHAADFHLGSPFSGFDIRESEQRRAELIDAFAASLSEAVKMGCGAILIAGDLFDCGYVDRDTVKKVFGLLGGTGIPVVISPGNHDPMVRGGVYSTADLPDNIYIFDSPELSYFDFPELSLRVHGYAFESERYTSDPLSAEIVLSDSFFNVLCAHGDIYSPISTYAPINLRQLEAVGFDYVALGHIHKYTEPLKLGGTLVAYSGFPEGRSFDECGFGGALAVTLSREGSFPAEASRIILSKRQYLSESLDVTGLSAKGEVIEAIKGYVSSKKYGKETALRITLTGSTSPSLPTEITADAKEMGLAYLEIRNDTLPIFEAEYLENDVTLRGALYRQLLPKLTDPDPETRRITVGALRMGLAALEGKPISKNEN